MHLDVGIDGCNQCRAYLDPHGDILGRDRFGMALRVIDNAVVQRVKRVARNKGIDLAGRMGEPVQAAGAGKVTYVGSLRGYGDFLVIRHNSDFISVYAHTSKILVKKDQTVNKGQKIAELGSSDADQPKLHFEIRQQSRPVDPLKLLPAR